MSHRGGEGADAIGVGFEGADDSGLLVRSVDEPSGVSLGIHGESRVDVSLGGDEESSSGVEDFNHGFREDGGAVVERGLAGDDVADFTVDVSRGGVSGSSESLGNFGETAETVSSGLGVVGEFTADSLSALGLDVSEFGFVTVGGEHSGGVSIRRETLGDHVLLHRRQELDDILELIQVSVIYIRDGLSQSRIVQRRQLGVVKVGFRGNSTVGIRVEI